LHWAKAYWLLAWPRSHGSVGPIRAGLAAQNWKQGSGLALAHVVAVVAVSGSPTARGGGGAALERHRDVKNPFWDNGEEWLTRVALPMAARLGGGGSPVRGHWRGRGRSLCGRRGASSRGDACGGGPERPAHGGVPDGEEEGGLSGGGDRRLWLGHTSRKSAEWLERCVGPMWSSWRLKRGRSRGVLPPMAGGVDGRRCTLTERAKADESVGVKVLN
jgi:hypothetical protein